MRTSVFISVSHVKSSFHNWTKSYFPESKQQQTNRTKFLQHRACTIVFCSEKSPQTCWNTFWVFPGDATKTPLASLFAKHSHSKWPFSAKTPTSWGGGGGNSRTKGLVRPEPQSTLRERPWHDAKVSQSQHGTHSKCTHKTCADWIWCEVLCVLRKPEGENCVFNSGWLMDGGQENVTPNFQSTNTVDIQLRALHNSSLLSSTGESFYQR